VPSGSLGSAPVPGAFAGHASAPEDAPVGSGASVGRDVARLPSGDSRWCRRAGRPKSWEECPGCLVGPKHPGRAARGTALSQLPELREVEDIEELRCPASGAVGLEVVGVAVGSGGFGKRPTQAAAGSRVEGRFALDAGSELLGVGHGMLDSPCKDGVGSEMGEL